MTMPSPQRLEQFFTGASQRKAAALLAAESGKWDGLPDMAESPTASITLLIGKMEAAAQELDKADKPEELRKLQEELAELDDRERPGKHLDEIKAYIGHKKTEVALKACEKALDTTAVITKFGSELMEKAVTEQLSNALRTELKFFDVRSVPLNVRKSGEKGKTKHQLTIQAGVRPSGVLGGAL